MKFKERNFLTQSVDSAKPQAKIVQANALKSAKTVPMEPPQIKRLPSNNELLCAVYSAYPTTEPDVSDNGFQSCLSACWISRIPTWFCFPVHGSFRQQFSSGSSTKLLGLYVQLISVAPKKPGSLRNYRTSEGLALLSQTMRTKL